MKGELDPFFRDLGQRVKQLRKQRGWSQEDMIGEGYSARHWQQIESGRPINVATLLKICRTFDLPMEKLVKGLGPHQKDSPAR